MHSADIETIRKSSIRRITDIRRRSSSHGARNAHSRLGALRGVRCARGTSARPYRLGDRDGYISASAERQRAMRRWPFSRVALGLSRGGIGGDGPADAGLLATSPTRGRRRPSNIEGGSSKNARVLAPTRRPSDWREFSA